MKEIIELSMLNYWADDIIAIQIFIWCLLYGVRRACTYSTGLVE